MDALNNSTLDGAECRGKMQEGSDRGQTWKS